MVQKIQNLKAVYIVLGTATILIISAVVLIICSNSAQTSAASPLTMTQKSVFSISPIEGWWQGATNYNSMAVFQTDSHDCFVSAEYRNGTVDTPSQLEKQPGILTSQGYLVDTIGSQAVAIRTGHGPIKYTLYQSSVETPASLHKVKGGQEFGYVQLRNGYIKIMGYCDEPGQLPLTIPALKAIRFTDPE